ncbi:MAG: hypothetical protein AAB519_02440 [Patescibacteria group bacterium]
MNLQELVKTFESIRDIPYSIPLAYGETDHCCSGKNKLLKEYLESQGYEARFRVCSFRWDSIKLPKEVTAVEHNNDSTHAYLEVKIENEWKVVDATWDSKICSVFPIEKWDGISATGIAVKAIEIFSPEKSAEIMTDDSRETIEQDLKINGEFYRAFNTWLESLRENTIEMHFKK